MAWRTARIRRLLEGSFREGAGSMSGALQEDVQFGHEIIQAGRQFTVLHFHYL